MEQISILKTLSLLTPLEVSGFTKTRLGAWGDGGYVMLDHFPDNTVVYSLGVGGDVSWDLDIANRGLRVFQYDHTVASPPIDHPKFIFHKIGIGPSDDDLMKTLHSIMLENGHQTSSTIIKMDIEDAEWDIIAMLDFSVLRNCKQLIIEFHGLSRLADPQWHERINIALSKLRETHFPFHIHANNWGEYPIVCGVPVPDVVEVSYANDAYFDSKASKETFPTTLDCPNKANKQDYYLGRFEFSISRT